mmetsp:Transcript_9446/g.16190  ORF Transcript_9446/g.16190 Transcript_9446/m.16190 type:complete len:231 (-) Transcript_9446:141-833(-)
MTLLLEIRNLVWCVRDAIAWELQHGQGVQRNVRTRPGIGRRRQVIGVRLAGHFEDTQRHLLGNLGAIGEPLRVGPGLHDLLGIRIALLHLLFHVVESIEHQDHSVEPHGGRLSNLLIQLQRLHQGSHVVAALHPSQHLHCIDLGDERSGNLAVHDITQEVGLHIARVVDTRVHPVAEKIHVEGAVRRCLLQHFHHTLRLARIQCQRWDSFLRTLGHMRFICCFERLRLHR